MPRCKRDGQSFMSTNRLVSYARTLHRWAGGILAILLILISGTGTLLIWKNTYVSVVFPRSETSFERSIDTISKLVLSVEDTFGAEAIRRIEFGDHQLALSKLYLVDGRSAYVASDGRIVDEWVPNGRPEDWLLDLHHRLLTGQTGLIIVGTAGIATIVLIVAGLIAFWPTRRAWQNGLRLQSLAKAQVLRVHRNIGILLAAPILVIVLAGILLAFPQTARSALLWPHLNNDTYGEDFGDGVDNISGQAEAAWPRVIARAAAVFPDGEVTGLEWPVDSDLKRVLIRTKGEWSGSGASSVTVTSFDGYMDLRIDAKTLPAAERLYNFSGALHRSDVGGVLYNVIQSMIGLGLIYLAVLGLFSLVRSAVGPDRKH